MSQTTKNKLNKFLYDTPTKSGDPRKPVTEDAPTSSKEAGVDSAVTPTVNRLSWKDFMEPEGTTEDDAKTSPNERIMWDNRPCQNGITPVGPRSNKKRARSSSPISSPAFENKTPTVNVKKLAQALKSPHADPTLELWDRFSINKSDETMSASLGVTNPALAQLMVSSSPRPSSRARAGGGGNLRRVLSGINGQKRRKIENSRSCSVASDEQREMEAASKSSLVSALLENATSSFQEHSPGDRSPEQQMDRSPSPKKRRLSLPASDTPSRQPSKVVMDDESDYGDDDFDDDTFMELEATMTGGQSAASTSVQADNVQNAPQLANSTKDVPIEVLDDTDDELLNEFANSSKMTAAASKAETPSKPPTKGSSAPQARVLPPDAEDEFGDLDDDFDLEAVDLAMTQSLQQASRSNPTVCSKGELEVACAK